MVEFQPFANSICIALLAKQGPQRIVDPEFSCEGLQGLNSQVSGQPLDGNMMN